MRPCDEHHEPNVSSTFISLPKFKKVAVVKILPTINEIMHPNKKSVSL
jgi:hypothetical protein